MPTRTRSHQIEDLSRNRLHTSFESCGWTVEDLAKDYGEDLLVRIFDQGAATPYSFFVQAKATDRIASYIRQGSIAFPIETGHLRHWVRFSEPVILTVWDSKRDVTYWVCVQDAVDRMGISNANCKKKRLSVAIPRANQLDADGLLRISGIAKLRLERHLRENEGAQILIDLLQEKSGRKVSEYNADLGCLFLNDPEGGGEYHFFGQMRDEVQFYSEKLGLEPQQLLSQGLRSLWNRSRSLTRAQARKESREDLLELDTEHERRNGIPVSHDE
jgi:hypothetical protein